MTDIENEIGKLIKNGWLPKEYEFSNDIKTILKKYDNDDYKGTPEKEDIFNAFNLFSIEETRILIIGQDPYPDPERAHGLAFSFKNGQEQANDSLLNIYKAIEEYKEANNITIEKDITEWNTNLEKWATTNKVLLLNTALTHENPDENIIKKHKDAWKPFVKQIICNLIKSKIDKQNNKLAVFLWGIPSQKIFFEILNEYNDFDFISDKIKSKIDKNKYIKDDKFNINSKYKVLRIEKPIKVCNNTEKHFLICIINHPSQLSENNNGKFVEYSPNHFKACDDFLGKNDKEKYTWRDFPENNSKENSTHSEEKAGN